jgi:hypothetical protein
MTTSELLSHIMAAALRNNGPLARDSDSDTLRTIGKFAEFAMTQTNDTALAKPIVTDEMVKRAIDAITDELPGGCDCVRCRQSMRAALEAALGEK